MTHHITEAEARELLAQAYDQGGLPGAAKMVRTRDIDPYCAPRDALSAIGLALSQRDTALAQSSAIEAERDALRYAAIEAHLAMILVQGEGATKYQATLSDAVAGVVQALGDQHD